MKGKIKQWPPSLLGLVLLATSLTPCSCAPSTPAAPGNAPAIAASPSMAIGFSAEQGGPNPSPQTLEIHNSGGGTLDWLLTANADWLTLSPTGGSSTGEINAVTVSADIAGLSPGDYSATITISAPAASNSPVELPVTLTITSTTAPPPPTASYAVSLTVSPRSHNGLPGDSLDYTITVTNRGTEPDSYDITVADDQGWTLTCPASTPEIASAASEDITLTATIPADAGLETEDNITITASSQTDPTATDSASCTARVTEEEEEEQPRPGAKASVTITPSSITTSPGSSVEINVLVDAADYELMGIDVQISYDDSAMSTSEAQVTDHNLLGGMEIGPSVTDGKVHYAMVNVTPQTGISGSILTIEFTISQDASGSYQLTIIKADLADRTSNMIPGVITNDALVIVQ